MATVRIYQKPAGLPVNTSVFAVEILQNNIWYTRKVSWETLKGLIAGAESLVFNNGALTFTTPDGVAHAVLSVDGEITPNSANPVSGGAVSTALAGKQDTLTFDTVPTDGSTNPVESNGIYDALAGKQDTLTFDSTPTDGSTNPVTSAGIYAAISAITTGIDWKEAVATYADIATTYPNPQDGWTVTTLDDDHTYRYTGTEWVDMFSLITLATSTKDGLMSAADFTKLAGIEEQANKTVVSDTLTPSATTKKLATVSGGGSSTDILGDDADAILRAAFGEHTVTGNPVSVDAFLGLEVASECKVTMLPIQDLHGYDSPWVGGAGKNKIDGDAFFSGYKIASNSYEATNSQIVNTKLYLGDYVGQTITFSLNFTSVSGVNRAFVQGYIDGTSINGTAITSSGISKVTVTPTSNSDFIHITYGSITGTFDFKWNNVQLEIGSTATDYAPYENICPISGRNSVTVTRTGVNIWNEHTELGTYNSSDGSAQTSTNSLRSKSDEYISCFPSTTYYLKSGSFNLSLKFYDKSKNYISDSAILMTNSGTFTTPSNAYYIRFNIGSAYGTTYNNDISINYPSTDTAYHAYTAETHTHTYASTVYGAVDDFVSGEGKRTHSYLSYDSFTRTNDHQFYKNVGSQVASRYGRNNIICDRMPTATSSIPTGTAVNAVHTNSSGAIVVHTEQAYSSASAFMTAMGGQLNFAVRTSAGADITNTPEDISLIKGVNVLSTDGDSLEVKYSADIKAYIDSKLAQ